MCLRQDGSLSTKGPDVKLQPTEQIRTDYQLTDIQVRLLDAGRLVYKLHHSTSIHFVPSIFAPLELAAGLDHPQLGPHFTAFRGTLNTVKESTYLGLESPAAENYRVSRFPLIVSISLLHHKLTLETAAEQKTFVDCIIEGVLSHLPNQTQRNVVLENTIYCGSNAVDHV